ncbi:MAG: hypothetical protein H6Q77_574 [Gemmatimonadetes bacterium]|jgi:hypothetical protein|nr:hypothetical protein [Gemmatimonadota bacterium]
MKTTLHLRACGTLLCTLIAGNVGAQQLPDIVGIRPGMPAREAFAALQAKYPKVPLQTLALQLPTIQKPILIDFAVGFSPVQSVEERIAVRVTPPPEKQVVWEVQRFVGKQKINRANVLASLREKYGKEAAGFTNGTQVKDIDKDAADIWWIFDEQGHPAKFADSYNTAYSCQVKFSKDSPGLTFNAEGGGAWFGESNIIPMEKDLQDSGWCNTSMIAVIAYIGGEEIVTAFGVQVIDMPLAVRSARAEVNWLKDLASKQQQQQIEESKQAKPKL